VRNPSTSNLVPSTAAEYYSLRDARVRSHTGNRTYESAHCVVVLQDRSPQARVCLEVVCTLLCRWCREVTVVVPESLVPLGSRIVANMKRVDPFGRFEVSTSEPSLEGIVLAIGGGAPLPTSVRITSTGWYAAIATGGHPLPELLAQGDPTFSIGAIAAAALGVAQVFKLACGARPLLCDGLVDLFELAHIAPGGALAPRPCPSSTDVGRLLQVGAGSVGSSVAYCALLARLGGSLTVVDHDTVALENLPCSPLFDCESVGLKKAHAIAKAAGASRLQVTPYAYTWNHFVAAGRRREGTFDLWLPLANEENVRWSMQNNFPPLMLQASTTRDWGVNFGRHLPGIDECLACRFPQAVDEANLTCSTGPVVLPDGSGDAALPFLSMFAGALVVAGLLRLQTGALSAGPNYAYLDFGSDLATIHAWNRACSPSCGFRRPVAVPIPNGSRYELRDVR
jgi:hypothetical protein